MFTGIIEGLGKIKGLRPMGGGRRLTVGTGLSLKGTKIGDSIAVNGACLTVVELGHHHFSADLSSETLEKTNFRQARNGQQVNIERAMRLSDRLDGHLVSGHIDDMGIIGSIENQANAIIIKIDVPSRLADHMIPKGSVAVDGISLTINTCGFSDFTVSIIPHTAKITTIGSYQPGTHVNIETDMIGKYVARFTNAPRISGDDPEKTGKGKKTSSLDMDFLHSSGFL